MPDWLKLYHLSPYPARVLSASARGYYLRRWRYGPETERLMEEASERETWTPQRWKAWQEERLAYVLNRAATKVPYYREYWSHRRRHGDRTSFDELEKWPVLKKESVRQNASAFVAEDCNPRRMFCEHTSGTTGTPLTLWWSRETVRAWYALFEARVRSWNGVSRHDRWAMLGGQLVVPFDHTSPPFGVWNAGLNQLYLSSYHLTAPYVPAYLEDMRRRRTKYLLGYASSMYTLARTALELDLDCPKCCVAVSNAEPLYEHQRAAIAEAFHCAVRDTYGMSEVVCAASECSEGALHLWPEVGIVEVLDHETDASLLPGQAGRLICTGLLNADMPLIRYQVGDGGRLVSCEEVCGCGRRLPILHQVDGRLDDMIITRDGRKIGRLDPVFKADLRVQEAQIIQETLDRLRLRYVPAPGDGETDAKTLRRRLRDRVGDMEVVLEPVEKIPRGPNGKFRAVISHVACSKQSALRTR